MHSALSPYMDEYTDKYSSPKVIKTPQALELGPQGYYVEVGDATVVAARLQGFPKPSVEKARLAGRWP